jgi:hypothetical protein
VVISLVQEGVLLAAAASLLATGLARTWINRLAVRFTMGAFSLREEVAVLGRIGGDINPWVEGVAAFSIVDPTLQACSDRPGDMCETPWDYCCEVPALRTGKALVKVIDEQGKVVKSDARGLLGVKELDTVVVQGTAERDDAGNPTVLATGVYIQR